MGIEVSTVRAFAAIELPAETKETLLSLTARLRSSGARASWVKAEAMHLTLRFFGDVTRQSLERIAELAAPSCARMGPLVIAPNGVGAFPNSRRPNIVWVGVRVISGSLECLQACFETAACDVGLPPEEKPYHPHVTLARIKDRRLLGSLPSLFETLRHFTADDFPVSHVALFESTLTRDGPIHRLFQRLPLR